MRVTLLHHILVLKFGVRMQVSSAENDEAMYTAFTVTVDARDGISTGISAEDRALTLRLLADPATSPEDFRRPGHICPLRRAACCVMPTAAICMHALEEQIGRDRKLACQMATHIAMGGACAGVGLAEC